MENRLGGNSIGFNGLVEEKSEKPIGELFRQVMPKDLVKFGLIPEFVGRVPVVVALNELDEAAMVRILVEPKNALIKQFEYLFDLDGVKLEFTPDAVRAVAKKAMERNIGARGLRAILEKSMMDLMYRLPDQSDIGLCRITADVINGCGEPELVPRDKMPMPRRRMTVDNQVS